MILFQLSLTMRLKIYLIFTLTLLTLSAFPQSDTTKQKRKIGFYSDVSGIRGNFSELNSTLSQLGYPELQNYYIGPSYGITLRDRNKNSYSFIKFSFLLSLSAGPFDNSRTKDARLRNWELSIGRNFDLVKHPKWLIYPFFGEGIGYGELTVYGNLLQQSFSNSASNLTSPISKTWSSFYIYFNAGVGIERRLRIGGSDFYIGLSGGYRLTYSRFTENNYPTYYSNNSAPVHLSGLEWNFRIRFERWRPPLPRRNRNK